MFAGMFINMRLVDKETHRTLMDRAVDGKVHITLPALADAVGVCPRTMSSVVDRLETCGKVKRLRGVGRGGMIYEVNK
jgi:MarR-like DNA-binding transcriptional regulator SgrR of sgrS sRNA